MIAIRSIATCIAAALLFAVIPVQRAVAASPAQASEQRVALIIGNAAYSGSPLRNPVNGVRAMAQALEKLGFTVIKRENLQARQIGPALREFRSRFSAGAVALFFYAGHGLQVRGVNYLPTVDADIDAEEDVLTGRLPRPDMLRGNKYYIFRLGCTRFCAFTRGYSGRRRQPGLTSSICTSPMARSAKPPSQ